VLHAVAEEGIAMRAIAEAIASGLGMAAKSLAGEALAAHFTWIARFVAIDNPTSSALTRERFGWQPTGPELLDDIAHAGYCA
jgi:hypothetical protein